MMIYNEIYLTCKVYQHQVHIFGHKSVVFVTALTF